MLKTYLPYLVGYLVFNFYLIIVNLFPDKMNTLSIFNAENINYKILMLEEKIGNYIKLLKEKKWEH